MNDALHLKNGRFIDVIGGRHYDDQVSVIVRDGKIAAMPGLPGEPQGMEGCRTLDLQGRVVIPGLFNTHCHVQLISGLMGHEELRQRQMEKNMADCLQYGVTNIRDAWSPDLRINRALIAGMEAAGKPAPRIHQSVVVSPAGGYCAPDLNFFNRAMFRFIDYGNASSGCVTFRPGASAAEVRDAVDRAIDDRGADSIKFYDQHQKFMSSKPGGIIMTDEQMAAAADRALSRGIPTTAHHTKVSLFRRDIRCGITSLAHLPFDELLTEEDIQTLLASGSFIEPTLSVSYGLCWSSLASGPEIDPDIRTLERFRADTYEEMMEECWLPEMARRYIMQCRRYASGKVSMMGIDFSAPFRRHTAGMPVSVANARLLYLNGGRSRIACGNDATVAFYTQAAIRLEFALWKLYLERTGAAVDPADFLRIATIQSARAMKLDGSFGSIETGKTADLVVLDGDPLEDWRLIGSKAAAVFRDGKLVVDNCGLR